MSNSTTAILTFMRHGDKDSAGDLTGLGHAQAKLGGIKTSHLSGDIILFHSGVGRVRNTVRTMAAHLHLSDDQEEVLEIGEHIADYVVPDLHYLIDPNLKGDYFAHWDDIELTPANIQARMEQFVSYQQSPEPAIFNSPRQMAKNVAKIIDTEIRFANLTDRRHKVNFVNGSHEPVLMAFIYYFLNDYSSVPNLNIADIGGPIDYAESFDIHVRHLGRDEFELEFRFRDIKKPLDLNRLREFAESI